jgi:hypothetical protein
MSPETIHAVNAISNLLDKIGTLPIGTILVLVTVGPWVFSMLIGYRQDRQFREMKAMYESNVRLVTSHQKVADVLVDTVSLNTSKWTEALDGIRTNQFCPMNRTTKVRMEDVP